MISKKNRISKHGFPEDQIRGFRVFSHSFTAVFYQSTEEHRVAVVVSKKMAKTAVLRNLLRRRSYDAISPCLKGSSTTVVVVFPKKELPSTNFIDLKTEFYNAFRQVKLL
ncbi:hypothetical protein AUJ77_03620 [Candidatus Nomurabacteria bacterium CG1_02_43_90]|uniref:Uncharacterized protein n=1 Tax=Candidatus Nomurabacteria bacterium CG1_02_43_90 TaxID=1805281 RepID=A0A1J4V5X2_9BACT|nr:MAG: hypothetical protein AUJ77_03620 [Candidatus Nomurabacteria bacterium CG1_02_43_90]